MTCDFIDGYGERCFKETEIERTVYHPHHDEYVGQPESPFCLELCGEHGDEKVSWDMIQQTNKILLELDKG